MTPKQILDSFSETLMRDERILSAQERALVGTLLQHAKTASSQNHETQEAVRAVIASAVGETVAQRAFAVLGGSIVERILEGSKPSQDDSVRSTDVYPTPHPPFEPDPPTELLQTMAGARMKTEPEPPSGQPHGPGVRAPHKAPQPPGRPMGEPEPPSNQPPSPGPGVRAPRKEPDPPSHARTTTVLETGLAVADRPAVLPARCVVLDEFLAPQELEALTRFTLEHESDFSTSSVVSPNTEGGVVNYDHRRSRVLMDLAHHEDVMLDRIKSVLPMVLDKLGMEEFAISGVEAQVTASNDGDFFHFHSDNGSDRVRSRHLTFVYFFHGEPRQFEGGELRIHDAHLQDGSYVSDDTYQTIVPRQNQIVFFPCELLHEITPVRCASQHFADSRFTLNGWLRH
jgi:Rps23 Pro-64 3,4-dihydroxylase Tpa1-like proline 4-hydroxylase